MRGLPLLLVALSIACAPHRNAPLTPPIDRRLAEADDLVRAGCFDCLRDALARYGQIADTSGDARAAEGVRATAGLLAIRERDLGLVDLHYLEQARDAAPGADTGFLLDVVATLPRRFAGTQRASDDAEIQALIHASRNRDQWRERLKGLAVTSPFAASAAIAFECTYGERATGAALDALLASIGATEETPLVRFARATCGGFDIPGLSGLLEQEPRFAEINYFLGVGATLKGRLDDADRFYQRAFEWHHDWPAVTIAIAHLAMTAEDFDRAADFYQRTLAIVPANADAQLGLTRALSYSGRYRDATTAANVLLSNGHWYVGDAYYWRAWNEAQLDLVDRAWADVHEAAKTIVNADVPKLTGAIAIQRNELATARAELQTAHERNPKDCETSTLLGGTALELRDWPGATTILVDGIACLDRQDEEMRAEIERLRAGQRPERIIARREQTLAADEGRRQQSLFNLAVAAYNMGDRASARGYAERLLSDERFGDRARQLLDRLKP